MFKVCDVNNDKNVNNKNEEIEVQGCESLVVKGYVVIFKGIYIYVFWFFLGGGVIVLLGVCWVVI